MIGDLRHIMDLPIGTISFTMVIIILIITYPISSLAALFYERRHVFVGNTRIPSELRYLPWALVFFAGYVLTVGILLNIWGKGILWIALLIFQMIFGVLKPIAIISTSPKLRLYVQGILEHCTIFLKNIKDQYLCPRSSQVSPIQE